MSTRLVAAITLISAVELNPSSWFSSSSIVRCTSRSPAFSESNRFVPMASSSSMKITAGDFSFAKAKASRTSLAPSPMNI
uniref:Putative secreted protein n=1 Tax=Anopheles darlingi TaxID=43151 RepID=A0A2M4D0N0_ANODA